MTCDSIMGQQEKTRTAMEKQRGLFPYYWGKKNILGFLGAILCSHLVSQTKSLYKLGFRRECLGVIH